MDTEESLLTGVRSGEFVAEYMESMSADKISSEAVQPNGFDLSIGTIYSLSGRSYISNEEYEKATRREVEPQNGIYHLNSNTAYIVVYDEKISIPKNHIGLVLPRSRLMRCGLQVETAVWDSGYTGVGEGQLVVNQPAELEDELRLAQMVFLPTEELDEHYDGSHQNERI